MKIVSPFLKRIVYPCLGKSGYLPYWNPSRAPCVVTYHGVLPSGYEVSDPALDGNLVAADSLRSQLRLLKSRYNVVSPEQMRAWCANEHELQPRSVLLTCDDGLLCAFTDMLPILQEEATPCLFFVTGAALCDEPQTLWYEELYLILAAAVDVGLRLSWNSEVLMDSCERPSQCENTQWLTLVKKLSRFDSSTRCQILQNFRQELGLGKNWHLKPPHDTARQRRLTTLTAAEIRKIVSAGFSIGAHTLTHPFLSMQSDELASHEISSCKRKLEELVGKQIWAFAYPFGDPTAFADRDLELVAKAGFDCAFVNYGGGLGAEMPRFAIPRVNVTAGMRLGEFEAHVSGIYGAVHRRSSRRNSRIAGSLLKHR